MSIETTQRLKAALHAGEIKDLTASEVLVMYVIADCTIGDRACLLKSTLGVLTCLSPKTLKRSLQSLRRKGLLLTSFNRARASYYRLRIPKVRGTDEAQPVERGHFDPHHRGHFDPPLRASLTRVSTKEESQVYGQESPRVRARLA
jgi:hypothetical protein